MEPLHKTLFQLREDASQIFYAGFLGVDPQSAVKKYCRIENKNNNLIIGERIYDLCRFKNIYVIGAGKASASMAKGIEEILGNRISKGIINVKYEHLEDLKIIRLIEAGHPVPDSNGLKGAEAMLALIKYLKPDDLVICLISGGGSALLPLPANGLTLKDKQDTIKVLLSCGADIHEINTIRKHVSLIKGGRLVQHVYPATLVSLILSDVVGDNLDVISSGPTVPDISTFSDCLYIIDKYQISDKLPASIFQHIKKGVHGEIQETPKADDKLFENTYNKIIGSNIEAILAAKDKANRLGYNTLILSSMIEGDTVETAHFHAAIAREILKTGHPVTTPACIISGGETTIKIKGKGLGGRNQEFVLAAALKIIEQKNIVVLSCGTDGTDGPTDAAGAVADNQTIKKAQRMGIKPQHFLDDNDSYHFFEKLGDLIKTGPTNTNVMDLRIVLVESLVSKQEG
ncbi:MAG: glycerate kinase [Desulfobacterales bacterium]|nr:glycerate kinase [Desulfobacterales bacterium]